MKRWSIAILLTAVLAVAGARADSADEVLERVRKKYDGLKDVSISFVQSVTFGVTRTEQTFRGTLLLKKGNKVRIEMEHQTIVTDGTSVWSYNPATHQLLIDRYREDPRSISADRLLASIPKNYTPALLEGVTLEGRELEVLKLTPRESRAPVKWMKVWVDREEWLMRQVQVMDNSDNLITYRVGEMRLNSGVTDSQFRFDPPSGTEVIDLR